MQTWVDLLATVIHTAVVLFMLGFGAYWLYAFLCTHELLGFGEYWLDIYRESGLYYTEPFNTKRGMFKYVRKRQSRVREEYRMINKKTNQTFLIVQKP